MFCPLHFLSFQLKYYHKIEFQMMSKRATFLNMKQVLFPILGLLLFALGKLLNLVQIMINFDYTGLHTNLYTAISYFFLVHLPLRGTLALYENFLYGSLN